MRNLLQVLGMCYNPDTFKKKFAKADADKSGYLDFGEFKKFFHELITGPDPLPHQQPEPTTDGADDDDDEEDEELPEEFRDLSPEEQQKQIKMMSLKKMLIGTFLVLIFSDPMVDVLAQIGAQTGIPPFYVSFILAPLASNASELLSSKKLAERKTTSSITASLQTLEGAACMNNTFCLGIFFVLIYVQGLAWKFTAETATIFFVQVLVFGLVMKGKTQTMKDALIIFACYPVSLIFVAVLEACGID
jgi:Ca2+/Na+ antiporter